MHLEWSREGRVATVAIRRRLDAMSVTNYCCKSQDCSVNSARNFVTKTSVNTNIQCAPILVAFVKFGLFYCFRSTVQMLFIRVWLCRERKLAESSAPLFRSTKSIFVFAALRCPHHGERRENKGSIGVRVYNFGVLYQGVRFTQMRLLEAFALKECSHDVCLTQYVKAAAETHRYSRLFLEVMSTAVSDNMLKLTKKNMRRFIS